jgi:hypothetical protein
MKKTMLKAILRMTGDKSVRCQEIQRSYELNGEPSKWQIGQVSID